MSANRKNQRDGSVLTILYDEYCRTYPTTAESMQRMVESMYQDLYHCPLELAEQITAVVMAILDDETRFAYEDGVKTGVQLALDLELDSMMFGGCYVSDC